MGGDIFLSMANIKKYNDMKTQEEYALEIDRIVLRDVESCRIDWFGVDRRVFMLPENRGKVFILGTRNTGCDLIVLGGTNCNEATLNRVFGCLGNEKFYVCQPASIYDSRQEISEELPLYAFAVASEYFRSQGVMPVFKGSDCKLIRL